MNIVICMEGALFSYSLADLLGFSAFVQLENLSCPLDDCRRESGESRYFDAVALACRAGLDGVQEDDSARGFLPLTREVARGGRQLFGESELVVVGGEERARADALVQVLDDGPGEREAVVGAGAAADFVEQDKAARRGCVEDVRRSRSSRP